MSIAAFTVGSFCLHIIENHQKKSIIFILEFCARDCLHWCLRKCSLGGSDKDFSQLFDWFTVNEKMLSLHQRSFKRSSDRGRIDGVYLCYPNPPAILTHAAASACRLINNNKFVLDTNYCFPGNCEAKRMKSGNLLIVEALHNLSRANEHNACWVFQSKGGMAKTRGETWIRCLSSLLARLIRNAARSVEVQGPGKPRNLSLSFARCCSFPIQSNLHMLFIAPRPPWGIWRLLSVSG